MTSGYVRLVVPDFEIYADAYTRFRQGHVSIMPYGEQDAKARLYSPVMSVNRIFYSHGHKFIYDAPLLSAALLDAGFNNPKPCSFRTGSDPDLILDSWGREVESLYIEAQKT
jgi:hypothetical protein